MRETSRAAAPAHMSNLELLEALELAATRARLAAPADLRKVADAIAGLALEAAARIRQFEARRS